MTRKIRRHVSAFAMPASVRKVRKVHSRKLKHGHK